MVNINVRDFMTEAQKADVDSGRASLDVTDAFQKAVDTAAYINSLQAALREALKEWQKRCQLVEDGITDNVPMIEENNRIAELRKLFLEDI